MMGITGTITEYRTPDQVETLDKDMAAVRERNNKAARARLLAQRDRITSELVALGEVI